MLPPDAGSRAATAFRIARPSSGSRRSRSAAPIKSGGRANAGSEVRTSAS